MSVGLKSLLAFVSAVLVLAGSLAGAGAAAADSIQVQSYQRASATAACVAQPGETPWQANWGTDASWKPSWEQWANTGKGGWVCTRSITWAITPAPASSGGGSVTYRVGEIGPGGGLVFLISGGKTYEMAPKTWGAGESGLSWCHDATSDIAGAAGTAIGTGSSNTIAMQSPACTSGAGVSARAYPGGGLTDWFLPSKVELNAMYTYSQVGGFNAATYGFASGAYWTSSQVNPYLAFAQNMSFGTQTPETKSSSLPVRPVRAF